MHRLEIHVLSHVTLRQLQARCVPREASTLQRAVLSVLHDAVLRARALYRNDAMRMLPG